jgi:hypothetical protein
VSSRSAASVNASGSSICASISVDPIGGLVTELVDVVPQQIVAALGG